MAHRAERLDMRLTAAADQGYQPARYHDRPGVTFVPFRDGPSLDYGVLWPATAHPPSAVAFVDLLRETTDTKTDHDIPVR